MKKYFFYMLLVFVGTFFTGQSVSAKTLEEIQNNQKQKIIEINNAMKNLLVSNSNTNKTPTIEKIKKLLADKQENNQKKKQKQRRLTCCFKKIAKTAGIIGFAALITYISYYVIQHNSNVTYNNNAIMTCSGNYSCYNAPFIKTKDLNNNATFIENSSCYNETFIKTKDLNNNKDKVDYFQLKTIDDQIDSNPYLYQDGKDGDDFCGFKTRQKLKWSYKIKKYLRSFWDTCKADKTSKEYATQLILADQKNSNDKSKNQESTEINSSNIYSDIQKINSDICQKRYERDSKKLRDSKNPSWFWDFLKSLKLKKERINCFDKAA
jgi:hypothetical protein